METSISKSYVNGEELNAQAIFHRNSLWLDECVECIKNAIKERDNSNKVTEESLKLIAWTISKLNRVYDNEAYSCPEINKSNAEAIRNCLTEDSGEPASCFDAPRKDPSRKY